MQHRGGVVGVRRLESAERCEGLVQRRRIREQRLDGAAVVAVQSGLGALQHLAEAIPPRHVQPHRLRGVDDRVLHVAAAVERLRGVDAHGQLQVAAQPLLVGHRGDVAEVRLGGHVERGDDLVAAGRDGVGVTGDLVEQTARARRGVVDLVDVGTELAAAGSHAALRGSRTDPVGGAGGVDEHLLDVGRGGGLERRHRGGADEDAVERHRREPVLGGPASGQVVGGPLRGADAAADTQHEVVAGCAARRTWRAAGRRGPPTSGGHRRGRPRCGR